MLVSLIVAMDRRGLIGNESGLPWRLSADLKRFRAFTWGKPIVMGRRTMELIGKPLPGRFNIVLSRNPAYMATGCEVTQTLQEALALAQDQLARAGGNEVMIIGGGKVYAEAIPHWDRLYVSVVDGEVQGSVYFPIRTLLRQRWRPVRAAEVVPADEKNSHRHTFHVIERVREPALGSPAGGECALPAESMDSGAVIAGLDLNTILARGTVNS